MVESLITQAEFARAVGVSRMSVTKAVQSGRLRVFNSRGERVAPGYSGKRWLKADTAAEDWNNRRLRLDDNMDGASDLVAARARVVSAQADLLEMRIARERGELISRSAVLDYVQTLMRAIQRLFKNGAPEWGEELYGQAQASCGLPLFVSMLRCKLVGLNSDLADLVKAGEEQYATPDDGEGATNG